MFIMFLIHATIPTINPIPHPPNVVTNTPFTFAIPSFGADALGFS